MRLARPEREARAGGVERHNRTALGVSSSAATSAAAAAPGVQVVVTGRDFPLLFGAAIKDQPFLAIDRVRYVGEQVRRKAGKTGGKA